MHWSWAPHSRSILSTDYYIFPNHVFFRTIEHGSTCAWHPSSSHSTIPFPLRTLSPFLVKKTSWKCFTTYIPWCLIFKIHITVTDACYQMIKPWVPHSNNRNDSVWSGLCPFQGRWQCSAVQCTAHAIAVLPRIKPRIHTPTQCMTTRTHGSDKFLHLFS
jgi:hypothetical protein